MKVLMIGGDKRSLQEGSEAYQRLALQRAQVERLDVFVWPQMHSWGDVMNAAKTTRYDVVTTQDPFWRGVLAWRAARVAHAKLNVQVHVDLSYQPFVRHVLSQIILRHADTIRVVSEKLKAQVERVKVRGRVDVLPLYVDIAPYQNLMHHKHPRFFRTILWLGRFEPEKDPGAALAVLAKARKAGIDACLIMLGEGSMKASVIKQAREHIKCVEFPGWQHPAAFLAMADVVISTSKHESYGVSIIEALAAGVPVVAPDVGIAREAGAYVVAREKLAEKTVEVLERGERASLKLSLLGADAWAKRWRETLV